MFHQKQTTADEASVGMKDQDAQKKASDSDQPPHAPILMNSTSLITLDNDADDHSESTVNDGRDHSSEFATGEARAMLTNIGTGDIASDEVDLEITGDEDSDPYDEVFEPPRPIIQRPNSREIASIDLLGLPFDLVRDNLHHDCRNRYEFDWLNLRAYADNWDCLDSEMQKTIRAFVDSDLRGNNLKHGMKRRDEFHKHLLLLAGCEIWNIRQYTNTNMVLSNLRDQFGNYSWPWTKDRSIDARDCNQAAYEFIDTYDPGELFRDFNAQIIQFEACSGYRHQPEPGWLARGLFKLFFKENGAILKAWVRSGLIYSYIYSHEVSCDSILGMRFRPHTHAIVFFKKSPIAPDFEAKMRLTDRRVSTTGLIHTRYATLEKFIRYLYGAYSLVEAYERERRNDNLLNLNRNTVQALRAIMELDSGVQRNNHSYIPEKSQDHRRWVHPLLEKEQLRRMGRANKGHGASLHQESPGIRSKRALNSPDYTNRH